VVVEAAAFDRTLCIAASRNDGDYWRVSRVVTTYRVWHEQRTFLLGKKRP